MFLILNFYIFIYLLGCWWWSSSFLLILLLFGLFLFWWFWWFSPLLFWPFFFCLYWFWLGFIWWSSSAFLRNWHFLWDLFIDYFWSWLWFWRPSFSTFSELPLISNKIFCLLYSICHRPSAFRFRFLLRFLFFFFSWKVVISFFYGGSHSFCSLNFWLICLRLALFH